MEGVLLGKSSDLFTGEQGKELKDLGDRYQKASQEYANGNKDAVIEMGYLKEQAEALAQAAYDNSEWASKELTAQEENTAAIRELTGHLSEGILLRYQVEQEGTKGFGAVSTPKGEPVDLAYESGFKTKRGGDVHADTEIYTISPSGSHASGLQRVPRDDYLALLHEGERVLTAREVREADAGGGAGGVKGLVVNFTGDITVREEGDLDRIAQGLADKITLALEAGTF